MIGLAKSLRPLRFHEVRDQFGNQVPVDFHHDPQFLHISHNFKITMYFWGDAHPVMWHALPHGSVKLEDLEVCIGCGDQLTLVDGKIPPHTDNCGCVGMTLKESYAWFERNNAAPFDEEYGD